MSTPDTNNPGIKLQDGGENLNTWGNPNLNNALVVLSNLASKFNPITINGDYSFASNTTNYSTSNPDEVASVQLIAGTVTGNFNLILAGRHKRLPIWNSTGFTAQVRLSASTGFALPSGYIALIATDGVTDVWNITPSLIAGALTVAGPIHGVTAGTASTDATTLAQVQQIVATAAIPAAAGTVLIDGNDSTAGYPATKFTAFGLLTAIVQSPHGNESLAFSAIGYAASGTNAYAITPSPTPSAPSAFKTSYLVEFTNANTAGCTLNDGSGTYALLNDDGVALLPYDIPAGAMRMAIFDGTAFRIKSADIPCNLAMDTAMAVAGGASF